MAAQPSTSTEIHPELSSTGGAPKQYLQLAKEFLRKSQERTSGKHSNGPKFNHKQCLYLVRKLETAVQSAMDCMNLPSPNHIPLSMINWKLLVRLAMDVEIFVQNCCKDEWIQAASMSMNAFEHVASLDSHLELCIWSNRDRKRNKLESALRRELTSISDYQERRLTRSQSLDLFKLLNKMETALNLDSISNLEERQCATSLLERLKAAMDENPIPEIPDLAKLSLLDQEELLRKVEAALNSEHISNPEHHQLATSLRGRLKIAVSNRTPHTPNLALLSFLKVEDGRLDQEKSSGTDLQKCQLLTSLLERLKAAVAKPIPDETDSAQLEFRKVDFKSLKREEILGKGSAAIVYRVKWLGVYAAEKKFHPGYFPHFNAEVLTLAKLSHPNIVPLLCYTERGSEHSMVIELMDKNLTELIEERLKPENTRFPFSTDESVDIILQIAEGMDYLHRERILHRDLKSENILVKCVKLNGVEFLYAKVADFNISKTKDQSITLSHPTWNRGTNRWMAPEVIRFGPPASENIGDWYPDWNAYKCDVYSFSMVCYEILTGHVPFLNDFPNVMKKKVLQDERPPFLPNCSPPCLRSMIQKCWRPEPMERPSFAEICRELRFMKGSLLIGRDL